MSSQSDSVDKKSEKILNTKTYFLNKSNSKYISVGIGLNNLEPIIHIGGQNGFLIAISEQEWKQIVNYQGVIANYFYFNVADSKPLKIHDLTIYFEKSSQCSYIRIQKDGGKYVSLGVDSVDTLWQVKELIDYRINIIKKQGFDQYFDVFKSNNFNQVGNVVTDVTKIIDQINNPNSENVSTMLEMLTFYPIELELKLIKRGNKRKYYEENSDY